MNQRNMLLWMYHRLWQRHEMSCSVISYNVLFLADLFLSILSCPQDTIHALVRTGEVILFCSVFSYFYVLLSILSFILCAVAHVKAYQNMICSALKCFMVSCYSLFCSFAVFHILFCAEQILPLLLLSVRRANKPSHVPPHCCFSRLDRELVSVPSIQHTFA